MREESATGVIDAFERAVAVISDWTSPSDPRPYCWFRGSRDARHQLLPGAYWRSKYDEFEALVAFCRAGPAFAPVGRLDTWDSYYLAQHHGLPTRLLDWSEGFASALFFALAEWDGSTDPCIWIMQPFVINRLSLQWDGVLCPENYPAQTRLWLPAGVRAGADTASDGTYIYDNRHPLAITPTLSNKRLVSQQGVFTVHGLDREPLEQYIADNYPSSEDVLAKITLKGCSPEVCRNHLDRLGVRRSTVYPDIDNFVKELAEVYGFQR